MVCKEVQVLRSSELGQKITHGNSVESCFFSDDFMSIVVENTNESWKYYCHVVECILVHVLPCRSACLAKSFV